MSTGDDGTSLVLDIGDDPVPSDGVVLLSNNHRPSSRSGNGNVTPRTDASSTAATVGVAPPLSNGNGNGAGASRSRSATKESKDKRILMSPSLSKSGSKSSKTGTAPLPQHSSSTKSLRDAAMDIAAMTPAERYKLRHSMRDLTSPHHPRKRTTARKTKGSSDVFNFGNLLSPNGTNGTNGAGGTMGSSDDDLEALVGAHSDDPDAIEIAADVMAREAANEAAGQRPSTAERQLDRTRRQKRRTASRAYGNGNGGSGSDGDHDSDKEKDTNTNNNSAPLKSPNPMGGIKDRDGVLSLRNKKKADSDDEDERKKPQEADILTLHHDNDDANNNNNDNADNKSSGSTADEEAALLPGVVTDPTQEDGGGDGDDDDQKAATTLMSPPPGGSRAASLLSPGRGHLSRASTHHKQSSVVGREQLGAAVAAADDADDDGNTAQQDISEKETEVDDDDDDDDDENDQHAAVFQRPGRKSMARKRTMWCARYIPCLRIINPREDFRMGWDFFVMAILIYNLMEIPFRLCFRVPAAPLSAPDIINLLTDVFWMLDVIVHFRTGYYNEDTYIDDPKKIALSYLRSWAVLDIITSLPAGHIVQAANVSQDVVDGFRAIRLLKLVRFAKLLRALSQQEVKAGLLADVLAAVQFIVLIFIIAHLSACFWFAIAAAEIATDGHLMDPSDPYEADPYYRNWLAETISKKNASLYYPTVDDMDLTFKYFLSLYWAFATIATVGYGDVSPVTQTERIFLCFIMLIGAVSFGYTISNVTALISLEDDTGRKIRDKISSINQYMHYRKLPEDLQRRIRAHYEYAWKRQTVYDEREILTQLPSFLRTKVALRLNKDLIQNVPFFKDLGNDCLAMLVTELKPLQIPPGTVIFKYGALGREMYFVSEGAVEVLGRKEKVLCTLERGAYFGEYALLSNRPTKRSSTVRSIEFTDLFSLTKTAFDEVLKVYPELHGKIARRAEAQLRALLMTRKTDEDKRKAAEKEKERQKQKVAADKKKAADELAQANTTATGDTVVPTLAIGDIAAKKAASAADGKDDKAATAAADSSSSSESSDDDDNGEFGESSADLAAGGDDDKDENGKKKKKKAKKQRTPGREKISARTRHLFRETKRLSMATIPNMSLHVSRPSMSAAAGTGPGGVPVLDKRASIQSGGLPMLARRGSVVPGATAGDIPLLGDIPLSAAAVHAAHMHHMSVHLQGGGHQGQGSPGRSMARTEEEDAEFWKHIESATSSAFQQLADKRKQHEQRQERLEKNVASLTAALSAVAQSINSVKNARMAASLAPTTHTITTTTTTTPHANTVQVSTHLHRSQASTGSIIMVPPP